MWRCAVLCRRRFKLNIAMGQFQEAARDAMELARFEQVGGRLVAMVVVGMAWVWACAFLGSPWLAAVRKPPCC